MLDLEGRRLDGKFRLVARIGTGGMAEVFLARNELVDRDVAIKLIRPDIAKDEEMLARFRNEARAAGRIGNPHICEILDLGQSPIGPYIVMELLQGQSLAAVLARGGTLAPDVAAAIARQALEGLEAAHRAGIVHRDLKPENLFLHAPEGAPPVVKIMDFGVSKFLDGTGETETAHGILLGTPQYMAPEQVRGARNVDPRTDVWAMGAILYRALAGRDAFRGETMAASLLKIASEDPPPLSELAPGAPAGLVRVVERCLSRDPKARFPSAQALRKALEPFARPGPLPEVIASGHVEPEAAPTVAQSEVDPTVPRAPSADGGGTVPRWAVLAGVVLVLGGMAAVVAAAMGGADATGEGGAVSTAATGDRATGTDAQATAATPSSTPARKGQHRRGRGHDLAAQLPAPAFGSTGAAPAAGTGNESPLPGVLTPAATGGATEPAATTANGPGRREAPGETGLDDAPEDTLLLPDDTTPPGSGMPTPAKPPTPTPAPRGTVRVGVYLVSTQRPPRMTHDAARAFCRGLDEKKHLGLSGWKLLPLSAVADLAEVEGLPSGRFWTAANWKGRGKAVTLPSGRTDSASVTRRFRPLCAVKRP